MQKVYEIKLCQKLSIVTLCCQLSHFVVNCHTLLSIVTLCCQLSHFVVNCHITTMCVCSISLERLKD